MLAVQIIRENENKPLKDRDRGRYSHFLNQEQPTRIHISELHDEIAPKKLQPMARAV